MNIDGDSVDCAKATDHGSVATNVSGDGLLIVNADDWGRDKETTDRTLDCVLCGAVSSVSAMLFMEDSERGAAIAREKGIDFGLHLNLTSPFTGASVSPQLVEHQRRVARFLRRNRLAQVLFHPGLSNSFEYVVTHQIDEFRRIYSEEPKRLDGHHHMHLCANILFGKLIPSGIVVRRNFTFRSGEKGLINRKYRQFVDAILSRRYIVTDYFFALPPLQPRERLREIFSLAQYAAVEVETHPIDTREYEFLTRGEIFRLAGDILIARRYVPLPDWACQRRSAAASSVNAALAFDSTRNSASDSANHNRSSELTHRV